MRIKATPAIITSWSDITNRSLKFHFHQHNLKHGLWREEYKSHTSRAATFPHQLFVKSTARAHTWCRSFFYIPWCSICVVWSFTFTNTTWNADFDGKSISPIYLVPPPYPISCSPTAVRQQHGSRSHLVSIVFLYSVVLVLWSSSVVSSTAMFDEWKKVWSDGWISRCTW
jgi:hypothetical protein